jgi:hypothetical protein
MGQAQRRKNLGLYPHKKMARFFHLCDLVCKVKMSDIQKEKAYKRSLHKWIKFY